MSLQQTSGNITADAYAGGSNAAAVTNYIEDVFSTYLYTGTQSTQTLNNSIDLAGKGGLVWIKSRNNAISNALFDSARGTASGFYKPIFTNLTNAEIAAPSYGVTSFDSSGFSLGSATASTQDLTNRTGYTYASWAFREQPKFFDVVTYTGTGATQTIAHNLGSVPGFIIVKRIDNVSAWTCYHTALGASQYITLNTTAAAGSTATTWNATAPTSTQFTVGTSTLANTSGATYVAYLFAHNAGGFGLTGTDNVISCGSYTGNGLAAGPVVSLGYEPQYLMIKNASGIGNWQIIDNMRGMPVGSADATLQSNLGNAESSVDYVSPTATGFQVVSTSTEVNTNTSTYIYIAIRRPMKVPTDATKVFAPVTTTGTALSPTGGFPLDLWWLKARNGVENNILMDRLRWPNVYLSSNSTAAEAANPAGYYKIDDMTGGVGGAGSFTSYVHWLFKRAPGFFDTVCYTGTGTVQTLNHNLKVVPELAICKARSTTDNWEVAVINPQNSTQLFGGSSGAQFALNSTNGWGSTSFVASTFLKINTFSTDTWWAKNTSAATYVAYFFASCPGVSKIGSYTGTSATQTISCGFTGGARFVLIKRTDSTGDWYIWDTSRGMVSGTDPSLLPNSSAAEVNANSVYTTTGGFQIVSTVAGINASGGNYIYLAVA